MSKLNQEARVEASPNIAFIKYWGKIDSSLDPSKVNWALNPSLSMTLSKAKTTTLFKVLESENNSKSTFLQGSIASAHDFEKISQHVKRICKAIGVDEPRSWHFESENNFPMATGIASSASAFAALTWAVIASLKGKDYLEHYQVQNLRKISEISRWGSGSACRSVDGPFMLWENEAASKIDLPCKLYDTVIILSRKMKSTSSRDGHLAAMNSPKLPERLKNVGPRLSNMILALQNNNFHEFGTLLEEEALEMHEVARASSPPIDYFLADTKRVIEKLQSLNRRDFYFTMDAGPNIHVISQRIVRDDLNGILNGLSIEAELWEDENGKGPKII